MMVRMGQKYREGGQNRSTWLCRGFTSTGAQLSVVTEKSNVVTDGGRRKLSVVTDGILEKGRRYHTFSHTECVLDLSAYTN